MVDRCLACAAHAACDPTAPDPCSCTAGYTGDATTAGSGCTDVNECTAGTSTCDTTHGTCTNTAGSFSCACAAGFTGDGSTTGSGCTDIDECATATASCDNFTCVNTPGSYHCDGLYAVEPFAGVLARLDPQTFQLLDLVPLSSSGVVGGVTAMVRHPTTGMVYATAKVGGVTDRAFGSLDLATGAFTVISSVDRFSSLEFLPDGSLYGATGTGANTSKTLHTIDLATGTPTVVSALGNGGDGQVICYDSDAALMYHWSGGGSSVTMESFPLTTPLTITNVTPTLAIGEVFGCRYLGNHTFLVHDIDSHVRLVTSAGVVTEIPNAVTALFEDVRATLPSTMTSPHSVRPVIGAPAGGTTVTLRGIGLTGATAVSFGGTAAASFTVVDDTTITAVTPAVVASTVDVTVTGPLKFPATWPAAFSFVDGAPAVKGAVTRRAAGSRTTTAPSTSSSALQRKTRRSHTH